MKAHIVTLASVIVAAGAGAAYAANETVSMNAIDANGVGKEIGTLRLSDTKEGLEITPGLARLPRATTVSMSTSIRIVAPATGRTDSQRPAWRRAAITTLQTPASTSGRTAKATRAICLR